MNRCVAPLPILEYEHPVWGEHHTYRIEQSLSRTEGNVMQNVAENYKVKRTRLGRTNLLYLALSETNASLRTLIKPPYSRSCVDSGDVGVRKRRVKALGYRSFTAAHFQDSARIWTPLTHLFNKLIDV
jgi:hypothetical protein